MSLDEAEVTFLRKPETIDPQLLKQLAGTYETPTGIKFRIQQYSDVVFEFVVENGQVKGLKQRSPSGEYVFARK